MVEATAVADSMVAASAAAVGSMVAAVVVEGSMAVAAATAAVVDTANSKSHEQKARSNERAFFLPIRIAMPHSDSPA
jgi:hypothetical protein